MVHPAAPAKDKPINDEGRGVRPAEAAISWHVKAAKGPEPERKDLLKAWGEYSGLEPSSGREIDNHANVVHAASNKARPMDLSRRARYRTAQPRDLVCPVQPAGAIPARMKPVVERKPAKPDPQPSEEHREQKKAW